MINRAIKDQRKKFLAIIVIIFACALAFSSYASASYEVQRPVTDTGGKINQGYLWGESTTANGTPVSHRGIDFSYATGTNVYAVTDGTVVELKEDREDGEKVSTWGNYILIRHSIRHYDRADQTPQWAYGYSLYLHLKKNSVVPNVGAAVTAGQQIAQSDNTGAYSTGSHLHYQLVINPSANVVLEPSNTLNSEARSRNPEVWFTPFNSGTNTARAIGRVSNASGDAVGGKLIVGLQKPAAAGGNCGTSGGYATSLTYNHAWTNPDDIFVENFATTDVQPGTYHLYAFNSFNSSTCTGSGLYRDLGNYTFVAGQTTFIGIWPFHLPEIRGASQSFITVRNNSTSDTAKVNTSYFLFNEEVIGQRQNDAISANANLTFAPTNNPGPNSAVVVGSQDIGVIVANKGTGPSNGAYAGIPPNKTDSTFWHGSRYSGELD